MRKKERAEQIINRLKEAYPNTGCSLDYDDAWKLLVSVRLAAQCTDARVNIVVQDLYEKFPDVDALANCYMLVQLNVYGNDIDTVAKLTDHDIIVNYDPT